MRADTTEGHRNTVIDFAELALRFALGLGFIVLGNAKLTESPNSLWVKMFHQLGAGQWFQYFTGYMQIAGGLLMLIPRTYYVGAGLLACTMVGAVAAHLFFLPTGVGGALFPAAILGAIAVAVWRRRNPRAAAVAVSIYDL